MHHANQACQAAAAMLDVLVVIAVACLVTHMKCLHTVQHQHGDGGLAQTWPSIDCALTNYAILQLQNILHSFSTHEQ